MINIIDRNSCPDTLDIIAETEDGIIMAVAHKSLPVWGLQFHPESILTPDGGQLLENFLTFRSEAAVAEKAKETV